MGAGSGSVRARTTSWRLRSREVVAALDPAHGAVRRLPEASADATPTASSVARTPRRSGSPIFRQPTSRPTRPSRRRADCRWLRRPQPTRCRLGLPLRAEPAPAPPAEPVPAPPAGDTVQTWLNAELDGDPNRFRVDESRLLSVFFDVARSRHAVAAAPAPVAIPAEDETPRPHRAARQRGLRGSSVPAAAACRARRQVDEPRVLRGHAAARRPDAQRARRCPGQFPAATGADLRSSATSGSRSI